MKIKDFKTFNENSTEDDENQLNEKSIIKNSKKKSKKSSQPVKKKKFKPTKDIKHGIKKKRKSEDEAIDDKYKENIKRIKRMKKLAAKKFADRSVDISIRNIESKIKRMEIQVAEKELDILKLRDQKLMFKKDLKLAEARIKRRKELKKK